MTRTPPRCSRCGSQHARPIRRWPTSDYIVAFIGQRPFACQVCRQRFRSHGAQDPSSSTMLSPNTRRNGANERGDQQRIAQMAPRRLSTATGARP